jgi:hypothetical protein
VRVHNKETAYPVTLKIKKKKRRKERILNFLKVYQKLSFFVTVKAKIRYHDHKQSDSSRPGSIRQAITRTWILKTFKMIEFQFSAQIFIFLLLLSKKLRPNKSYFFDLFS